MKKKKDDTVVRTSVLEAIIVAVVCLVAFLGLVYIRLVPYIGESISESQPISDENTETEDIFSDEGIRYLDDEGNVVAIGTGADAENVSVTENDAPEDDTEEAEDSEKDVDDAAEKTNPEA